ncbi:hypothetical protein STEG23_027039 [Scotinomys teguina]
MITPRTRTNSYTWGEQPLRHVICSLRCHIGITDVRHKPLTPPRQEFVKSSKVRNPIGKPVDPGKLYDDPNGLGFP